jgi:hypothetical protein
MKKILMIAGGIFGFLIASVVVLIAVMAIKGRGMDRESKEYADNAIRAICSNWDQSELTERASPEMLSSIQQQRGAHGLFSQWGRLGALSSLEPLRGQANIQEFLGSGTTVTAVYVAGAKFVDGTASIKITLIKREDAWRILGLWVNGNLAPGAAAIHPMSWEAPGLMPAPLEGAHL